MLNGLDLFSGIGGVSYALREWVKPIAYCEIDPYCQGVLLSRISDGSLDNVPIWDDIKTLSYDGRNWPSIDIIYGGFPCQDISIAGHGKGLEGKRSGLFFEIMRLAKEIKPTFIFLENVPAITTRGGIQVVNEIASMGYDCRWCIISAASVGALHRRERWFLLAHANVARCNKEQGRKSSGLEKEFSESTNSNFENAHTNGESSKQANKTTKPKQDEGRIWGRSTRHNGSFESRIHWQETVSTICRVSDGIPFHVEQLRALGNSVVSDQAKEAFKILMGL